jgi:hypothetical protein
VRLKLRGESPAPPLPPTKRHLHRRLVVRTWCSRDPKNQPPKSGQTACRYPVLYIYIYMNILLFINFGGPPDPPPNPPPRTQNRRPGGRERGAPTIPNKSLIDTKSTNHRYKYKNTSRRPAPRRRWLQRKQSRRRQPRRRQATMTGCLKAVWPDLLGCIFEVWPAPGARESPQKGAELRPPTFGRRSPSPGAGQTPKAHFKKSCHTAFRYPEGSMSRRRQPRRRQPPRKQPRITSPSKDSLGQEKRDRP